MSATGKEPWVGGMAQASRSVDAPDHCEAEVAHLSEVAHLYRVLHRYRSLASESRRAESDGRPWEGERRAATGASHDRIGRQGP